MKSQNKVCNDCCTFSCIIIRCIDSDKMQQKPKCECKSLFASNPRAASNVGFGSFGPKTGNFEAFIVILKSSQLSETWTILYGQYKLYGPYHLGHNICVIWYGPYQYANESFEMTYSESLVKSIFLNGKKIGSIGSIFHLHLVYQVSYPGFHSSRCIGEVFQTHSRWGIFQLVLDSWKQLFNKNPITVKLQQAQPVWLLFGSG